MNRFVHRVGVHQLFSQLCPDASTNMRRRQGSSRRNRHRTYLCKAFWCGRPGCELTACILYCRSPLVGNEDKLSLYGCIRCHDRYYYLSDTSCSIHGWHSPWKQPFEVIPHEAGVRYTKVKRQRAILLGLDAIPCRSLRSEAKAIRDV